MQRPLPPIIRPQRQRPTHFEDALRKARQEGRLIAPTRQAPGRGPTRLAPGRGAPPPLQRTGYSYEGDDDWYNEEELNMEFHVWRTLRAEALRKFGSDDPVAYGHFLVNAYKEAQNNVNVLSGEEVVLELQRVAREKKKDLADNLEAAVDGATVDKRVLKDATNLRDVKANLHRVIADVEREMEEAENARDGPTCACCAGGDQRRKAS